MRPHVFNYFSCYLIFDIDIDLQKKKTTTTTNNKKTKKQIEKENKKSLDRITWLKTSSSGALPVLESQKMLICYVIIYRSEIGYIFSGWGLKTGMENHIFWSGFCKYIPSQNSLGKQGAEDWDVIIPRPFEPESSDQHGGQTRFFFSWRLNLTMDLGDEALGDPTTVALGLLLLSSAADNLLTWSWYASTWCYVDQVTFL